MADSRMRRTAGSRSTEPDCSQLTLEGWADSLRAIATPTKTSRQDAASGEVVAESASPSEDQRTNGAGGTATPHRVSATELLQTPGALLTRSHLRELGLERRAIDAVFRTLAVVFLPGYSRPMIRAAEFRDLVEQCTYHDDRVRPCHA